MAGQKAPKRPSAARQEREALAEAMLAAGPDAPTLCEGWTVLDLAAHVVVREHRPDSLPGLAGGPMGPWTERVRGEAAATGLPALVVRLRSGPPPWSPFALPGVDARANLLEYLVHHEDVRRADGTGPRTDVPPGLQDEVWASLRRSARLLFRQVEGGVTLRRTDVDRFTDGVEIEARPGDDAVVVAGTPVEVALYAFGRGAAAEVDVSGSTAALARLAESDLGV